MLAGQAPGARVHESGQPFTDRSGDRLREWLGVSEDQFYDPKRFAIFPMAFCFPGYDAAGADLPPPKRCAATWRPRLTATIGPFPLTLLVGGYAQRYYLGGRKSVTQTVADWRSAAPELFPLPHPSWRNTGWLKNNPWFEAELLPALRKRIAEILA